MNLSTNKDQVPLTIYVQGVHYNKYSYPTVDLYGIPNIMLLNKFKKKKDTTFMKELPHNRVNECCIFA